MIEICNIAKIKIRYAETDKMGIVYNGNYFTYFEVGRTELMRNNGLSYTTLEAAGYYLPLIESYAKYISPAYYDDELDVQSELKWDGSLRMKFDYSIFRQSEVLCKGHTLHCFTSIKTMRPVRPPKLFLGIISKIENGDRI